jgi:hypothetical protein
MSKLSLLRNLITAKLIDAVKKDEGSGRLDIADGLMGVETSIFINELAEAITEKTTTISGSKYNYTVQAGNELMSIGFDTHHELSRFVIAERHKKKLEQ